MLDFISIKTSSNKNSVSIYPEFIVKKSRDLMIRGKSFYAVWDQEAGFWSRDEGDVQRMVDDMLLEYASNYHTDLKKDVKLMSNFSSKKWTEWQQYCKSLPDHFHELDEKVTFLNSKIKKTDYVSRTLPYPLQKEPIDAYNELFDILYDPSERQKLEWAMGSIIAGDSKMIQKFIVLYGSQGSGKSTILNIIQELFEGYYSVFESKALASSNNSFALEAFRNNPLVAIQHDGDLSRIEDNTKLNSIVSHELMVVNEKFKATYASKFNSFLFMGTNKPVKITDAKSGIIRRLIDVSPSGRKIPRAKYEELKDRIHFELGGIAQHCLDVYNDLGFGYYDTYIPYSMLGATNDFYNFMEDNYDFFAYDCEEGVQLSTAWMRYKEYCEDANVPYPYSKRLFKDEMKNYFTSFEERYQNRRSVYLGFKRDKFDYDAEKQPINEGFKKTYWLSFDEGESLLDEILTDYPAQYANRDERPSTMWDDVVTKLKDLDTKKLHYVRVPENLIVIDFDIKGEDGDKSYELNLEAANKWPKTYAELSKSGEGIHLHYYYDGDVSELSRLFDENIEIKVFNGKSSLRRMVTKCNDIEIAHISSGLPLKERSRKVIKEETIKSERSLRDLIMRNVRKEIHPNTKPSIDFIYQILQESYGNGLKYDVTDLRSSVQSLAMSSSHNADYCLRLVSKMKFRSEEPSENKEHKGNVPIIFYDVEVFPNLFIVCWKKQGKGQKLVRMINPKASDVEELFQFRLIGFNNRRYDNHIMYAAAMGYSPEQLFNLSQRIIVEKDRDAFFGEAYNLSYTDIYDYLSAANKMSLKKWEIKLGIHHQEFDWPWDKPVPKEKWKDAADYCCNDVIATEAVFDATQDDFLARQILAEWANMTVNDTTNSLTTRLIVGTDRNPQSKYIYTDLSAIFPGYEFNSFGIDPSRYNDGTKIVKGKSIYRGEDPGEGGYVYAEPGMYRNVALLDVESMHPHSAIRLKIFGEEYTMRFENIVGARLSIKHKNFELAKEILPEKLHKYLKDKSGAKKLANALKTAINAVYGLTAASFDHKLRDPRNKDNIVAKYGALFMINLKHEVQQRGYTVVHIKTDSIKIADADDEIVAFVKEYGKEYGYTFDHEATYSKMCLVNDAVYIAKVREEEGEKVEPYWTATGTQFQIPYVFKTLFSKEPIEFKDLCETKSVSTAMYLDFDEKLGEEEHDYRFVGRVGLFCPVISGIGGGVLLRQNEDKFSAVTGTKKADKDGVYRWMEAEMVEKLKLEDSIDISYYNHLVDEAIDTISQYGDFEAFVSDDDWLYVEKDMEEGLPFELAA